MILPQTCLWEDNKLSGVWPPLLLTNVIPGRALPVFDTPLFIVNAVIVVLAAAVIVVVIKGQLGYTADQQQ